MVTASCFGTNAAFQNSLIQQQAIDFSSRHKPKVIIQKEVVLNKILANRKREAGIKKLPIS